MFAIVNSHNEVIGAARFASGRHISIAGAVAHDGAPVNVKEYRVSTAKARLAEVSVETPVAVRHEFRGNVFYTVED